MVFGYDKTAEMSFSKNFFSYWICRYSTFHIHYLMEQFTLRKNKIRKRLELRNNELQFKFEYRTKIICKFENAKTAKEMVC